MSPIPSISTPITSRHIKSQTCNTTSPTAARCFMTDVSNTENRVYSTTKLLASLRASSTPPERSATRYRTSLANKRDRATTMEISSSWMRTSVSKKTSQYYDEAFAYREPSQSVRSRMNIDALVSADVNLNRDMNCEQDFIVDMAFLLSEIYQRPAECIMIWVHRDSSVLLRTSSEPAYKISITALASEIAETKNRRAAGLLQEYMAETTRIPPSRGALFFYSIEEANVIANGFFDQRDDAKNELGIKEQLGALKSTSSMESRKSRKFSLVNSAITWDDTKSSHQGKPYLHKPESTRLDSKTMLGTDSKRVKKRKSLMALLGF